MRFIGLNGKGQEEHDPNKRTGYATPAEERPKHRGRCREVPKIGQHLIDHPIGSLSGHTLTSRHNGLSADGITRAPSHLPAPPLNENRSGVSRGGR